MPGPLFYAIDLLAGDDAIAQQKGAFKIVTFPQRASEKAVLWLWAGSIFVV